MAIVTHNESVLISGGGPHPLAAGDNGSTFIDNWCVQVQCNLTNGAHALAVGTAYSIQRSGGGALANMFCDELPQSVAFGNFEVGGGTARFSNRKLPDGRDRTYRPTQWAFGQVPHASGSSESKIDKSKLSFSDDLR
jgi:hypothetical protein